MSDSTVSTPVIPFGLMDLALLGVAAIWGANFVIIKAAVAQLDPLAFAAIRFCLATLVMLPLLAAAPGRPQAPPARAGGFTPRAWLQLALLAVIGSVLYQPAATLGLNHTTATNAALIISSAPAWVAVLGHLFGLERLGPQAWLGVGLSALGLGLVVAGGSGGLSLARENMLGNVLCLFAALGWAGSTLIMRPLVVQYSSVSVIIVSNLLAIPALLGLAVPAFRAQDWSAVTAVAWLQLVASALLAICLAYTLWAKGVQHLGATRTALYANLVPVFAVLAGMLFLAERLAWPQAAGALLVLVGIRLARQK